MTSAGSSVRCLKYTRPSHLKPVHHLFHANVNTRFVPCGSSSSGRVRPWWRSVNTTATCTNKKRKTNNAAFPSASTKQQKKSSAIISKNPNLLNAAYRIPGSFLRARTLSQPPLPPDTPVGIFPPKQAGNSAAQTLVSVCKTRSSMVCLLA